MNKEKLLEKALKNKYVKADKVVYAIFNHIDLCAECDKPATRYEAVYYPYFKNSVQNVLGTTIEDGYGVLVFENVCKKCYHDSDGFVLAEGDAYQKSIRRILEEIRIKDCVILLPRIISKLQEYNDLTSTINKVSLLEKALKHPEVKPNKVVYAKFSKSEKCEVCLCKEIATTYETIFFPYFELKIEEVWNRTEDNGYGVLVFERVCQKHYDEREGFTLAECDSYPLSKEGILKEIKTEDCIILKPILISNLQISSQPPSNEALLRSAGYTNIKS